MLTHSRTTIPTDSSLFRQQYRPTPRIDRAYWSFMLAGLVEVPLCLSYADLLKLPAVDQDEVIACIGNRPGGHCIGQASWHGVAMATLLGEVTRQPGARYAHLFAADGYSTSISMTQLEDAILVFGMNGDPLPPEHGYPARLVVPGLYGYKMPKWIQRIILAETPLEGLWEQRGWSASGEAQLTSHIVSPPHQSSISGIVTLRGIAYAGKRAIKAVELRVDGGPWMPANFTQAGPGTLAQWAIDWTPHVPGDHRITVRVTDETGVTQPDILTANPFPNGSSALHSITVRV